jgi:hypothetical protein
MPRLPFDRLPFNFEPLGAYYVHLDQGYIHSGVFSGDSFSGCVGCEVDRDVTLGASLREGAA